MKTNKKFKIFTPIVASSLAFLLGGSLYGQNITNQNCGASTNCTDITNNITFKFGNMPESTKIDLTGNTVTFGKDIVTATLKDTGFKTQKFNFPNKTMTVTLDSGKIFNLEAENAVFKGNLVINDTGSGDSNQIGAKFTGKFSHGMEGNITVSRTEKDENRTTLTFNDGDLGSQNNKSTITIQRAGTSENKSKDNNGANGALVLDFSKNSKGNLYANFRSVNQGGGNVIIKGYNNNNNTITTTLYGNIGEQELSSPSTKDLNITFENAKMVGNIGHTFNVNGSGQAQGNTQRQANDFQKRVVIFKNSASQATNINTKNTEPNYVLTGNINSFGTGYASGKADTNKGNHVIFEHGSMKGNIFASRYGFRTGYNEVIFKDANTTFFGTIRVAGSFQSESKNDVTFTGATNTLKANGNNNDVILSNGNGCDVHNNCQHGVIGSNNITFENTTTKNTIEGNITTEAGINNVIFENNTTSAQNNSIDAIIAMGLRNWEFGAFGGTNNITFKNHSGNNTIGSVSALKGTNNIIFGASAK
ncbi:hypothetical protein LW135_07440, partial [Helicobacter sp. faydin-H20]|uniref:hypothetical protein n=1 Tax=Helicobacter anatolicus TaxID=2905874 RepID=UPI001E2C3123